MSDILEDLKAAAAVYEENESHLAPILRFAVDRIEELEDEKEEMIGSGKVELSVFCPSCKAAR